MRKVLTVCILTMLTYILNALPVAAAEEITLRNEDFIGKRIAFAAGELYDVQFTENVGEMIPVYAYYEHEAIEFLKNGRVDAVLLDDPIAKKWVIRNPGLMIVYPNVADVDFGVVFNKDKTDLRHSFNDFLREIKENGIYDDMMHRWIETAFSPPMPNIPLNDENGILNYATYGTLEPFGYIENRELTGFDVEIGLRFAHYMDMGLEISIMAWDALIPYVSSGRADFASSLFMIEEEREQFINFSDPYYTGGTVIVTRIPGYELPPPDSFWHTFVTGFERNLIHDGRWLLVVEGLLISLIITFGAFMLATLLGFGVCWLRMSKNKYLSTAGNVYITLLRGTPVLVLLMIAFYVIFAKSNISATVVAIMAFGANGAAFIGEIMRSAIITVDKGQVEAAYSMGFSKTGTFLNVVFPQAVRVAFPVYMSEFVSMFKMTSVVGYIAIVDLTKAGDIIRSRTFDAFFPLIMVAVLYLITASILVYLFNLINRKITMSNRRAAK